MFIVIEEETSVALKLDVMQINFKSWYCPYSMFCFRHGSIPWEKIVNTKTNGFAYSLNNPIFCQRWKHISMVPTHLCLFCVPLPGYFHIMFCPIYKFYLWFLRRVWCESAVFIRGFSTIFFFDYIQNCIHIMYLDYLLSYHINENYTLCSTASVVRSFQRIATFFTFQ